jgi:1,4-dihydroxy-2-naphthoate octaprenyltransferase
MARKEDKIGNGIASFVLSLFSIILFLFFGIGILPGILALIYSDKQKKIKQTGLGQAGFVMGIIGIVINSFWVLIWILMIIVLLLDFILY